MTAIAPTISLNVYFSGIGSASTNIASDVVLGDTTVRGQYGIQGTGPLDRVGRTGSLIFSLDNSAQNSASTQGYYSPGHVNARTTGTLGWNLGVLISITLSYGGTNYIKFIGTLTDVKPVPGKHGRQVVRCVVLDWMDEASRSKLKGVSVLTNKNASELITAIVSNSVGRTPIASDYDDGRSTFAYAFDNFTDNKTSVMRALNDVVMSEMGHLYIKGTTDAASAKGGKLVFTERTARWKLGSPSHTFSEDMVSLDARQSRADIVNRTFVQVNPRTLDGNTSVLWNLTDTQIDPLIGAGDTVSMVAQFTEKILIYNAAGASRSGRGENVASTSLITPVSGTDWIANTAADGSGTNGTSSINMTVPSSGANSAVIQIQNTGSVGLYLTTLQLRGNTLKAETPTTVDALNAASVTTYGEQDIRINMPYESDPVLALNIAESLTESTRIARYVVRSMGILANKSSTLMAQALAREPGDKIGIVESMTSVGTRTAWMLGIAGSGELDESTYLDFHPTSGEYVINGVSFEISAGSILRVKWVLVPANPGGLWVLNEIGSSDLDTSTVLSWDI
jgi:hypothetical protein